MPGAVAKKKRKDELSQEDKFLHYLDAFTSWARVHTRAAIAGGVALALFVGGVLYYRSYRESLRTRAVIELNQLRVGLTVEDAIPRLTGFVARFDGTPSAAEGRLVLARLHLQSGQYAAAIEVLGPIESEPVDQPNGYAAAMLLADAYKNSGEPERALAKLDDVVRGAYVPFQRHRALAEKGRLLAELGRLEEAAATYRLLVEEEATDDIYRVRLGEVEALITSGATVSPTAFAAPAPALPEEPAVATPLDAEQPPAETPVAPSEESDSPNGGSR